MKKAVIYIAVAIFLGGCFYENEENLYPDLSKDCDTTAVTYSKSIYPILQSNCLRCHSATENAASGGNLNFDDFDLFRQLAVSGIVFGSITHNTNNIPMPKNGPKIDTCSITKIKIWIDHGAINN